MYDIIEITYGQYLNSFNDHMNKVKAGEEVFTQGSGGCGSFVVKDKPLSLIHI